MADLAGINFSDFQHCVAVLRVNTIMRFVSVRNVVRIHA